MKYFSSQNNQVVEHATLPADAVPFGEGIQRVLPPQVSVLHGQIYGWGQSGLSPGPIEPKRMWLTPVGEICFAFSRNKSPQPLMHIGAAPDVAAWLVLLDVWMETFVVVARARAIWDVDALASALTFMSPGFLPSEVVSLAPNWAEMARAVALAVADGPLAGSPEDRHWREK